jgi:hypothetical protein
MYAGVVGAGQESLREMEMAQDDVVMKVAGSILPNVPGELLQRFPP